MSVTFVTLDANDVEAAAVATQQDDARKRAKAFLKKYFMRGAVNKNTIPFAFINFF